MRTDADDAGRVATQEVRFRHDRIRDFFTHFTFVEMSQEDRAQYADDARFAGVFPYLARALPPDDAEDLRERLIRRAAEIEDHRVSDSFVREYTWRQRFAAHDPEWMLAYDLPQAQEAESRLNTLAEQRRRLDEDTHALREMIAEARRHTRILSTSDPAALRDAAAELLIELGAVPREAVMTFGRALWTPDGEPFVVTGLGQPDAIHDYHVALLTARSRSSTDKLLVVTNARTAIDPAERAPDLSDAQEAMLQRAGALNVSATSLYFIYLRRDAPDGGQTFWNRFSERPCATPALAVGV